MKSGVLGLLLLGLVVVTATKWTQLDNYSFEDYEKEFGKTYKNETERTFRRELFYKNLEEIYRHNKAGKSWKLGVNQFTDKTHAEYKTVLGLVKSMTSPNLQKYDTKYDFSGYPSAVDWRKSNIITAVKNQGECGSCWTFATAETVESYWANKTGELNVLSEQQILDCTPNPKHCGGTGGCQGGTAELAMERIIEMGGLSSEWTYSYNSFHGVNHKCKFDSNTPAYAKLKSYVKLPSNKYEPLFHHIATVGPLAISVDASSWSAYESGVYDGCDQKNPDIDHAVQLVGYGTTKEGEDYWLVRNSWSPTWGENGYIRLKRTPTTLRCGTDLHPGDGTACENGPKTVEVCGTCGILYDNSYPIVDAN